MLIIATNNSLMVSMSVRVCERERERAREGILIIMVTYGGGRGGQLREMCG